MSDEEPDEGRMNRDGLTLELAEHPSMVDDAPDLVALARTLADAIDADHHRFCPECKRGALTASLSTVYLKVLLELRGIGGGDEDGADDLTERLSSPLRDSKD